MPDPTEKTDEKKDGQEAEQTTEQKPVAEPDKKDGEQSTAQEPGQETTQTGTAVPRKLAKLSLPHLAARIFNVPLAISPTKLQTMLEVAWPRFTGQEIAPQPEQVPQHDAPPEAEGIAVLSIVGTLVKRGTPGDSMCELTYGEIEADFIKALNDPAVEAIVLDLHSPGGEVQGCFDLADTIYAARGSKPLVAVVNEEACSAAYALASAADRVIVPRTGVVGSVGVIAVHLDQSGRDEQLGLKYTTVIAGERKADFSSHEPLSAEAHAILQAEVDRIYSIFVETVARNRSMKADAVKKTEAAFYMGEAGVAVGFADEIGTMGSTLAGLLTERHKAAKHFLAQQEVHALVKTAQDRNLLVAKLCQLAGMPECTAAFLEQGLSEAQVKTELQRRRASQDEPAITSHVLPTTGIKALKQVDRYTDIYQRRRSAGTRAGQA